MSHHSARGRRNTEGLIRLCSVREDEVMLQTEHNSDKSALPDPEIARLNQDNALAALDLYRFRIPGDGNCLFRAIASQLELDQETSHPKFRRAAAQWMQEHADELLLGGLLDDFDEIEETRHLGMWPGQAAIVAMANILKIHIAVINGGDRGDIDIQHISPFVALSKEQEGRSIILAYLYQGHYDAVVGERNRPNPVFDRFEREKQDEVDADAALARRLAFEEGQPYTYCPPVPQHIDHNVPPPAVYEPTRRHGNLVDEIPQRREGKSVFWVSSEPNNNAAAHSHGNGEARVSVNNTSAVFDAKRPAMVVQRRDADEPNILRRRQQQQQHQPQQQHQNDRTKIAARRSQLANLSIPPPDGDSGGELMTHFKRGPQTPRGSRIRVVPVHFVSQKRAAGVSRGQVARPAITHNTYKRMTPPRASQAEPEMTPVSPGVYLGPERSAAIPISEELYPKEVRMDEYELNQGDFEGVREVLKPVRRPSAVEIERVMGQRWFERPQRILKETGL